ncbi:MAG: VWA domain-containing protein [Pelagimonas sp.]|jgi:uncharacterized protein with von Willebrand factor type A (vWA) domain|nr:VWA domain-containing protein [Pelagimonas sp.]
MSRVTRFTARDPGPAARMAGFMAHLRENGLRLGVEDTALALRALTDVADTSPEIARSALRPICARTLEDTQAFDALFDSFWLNKNRVRPRIMPTKTDSGKENITSSRKAPGHDKGPGSGDITAPDGEGDTEANGSGEGRLVASQVHNLAKTDLRYLVDPEQIAQAQIIARQMGAALRDRRSRRRKAMRKGAQVDFRRLMRHSLASGGDPFKLPKKSRPDRPLKIVALCDVSGSMTVYASAFLAFLAGLLQGDASADAYLFHTRLVRIADALRDHDPLRALGRLSVLADGFGGGSKIGASLDHFAHTYARRFVDGRSVVIILSDGYDTDTPEQIGAALGRLKKRGCKVIWLNPLKGWADYQPIARGMASALPHLDLFYPANRLEDLAALTPELTRL